MPSLASPPPAERTLYVVHFLQPIEESFLLRTFSHAGKIKKTIIGSFQPKRASKRAHKRRTLHYALVVFKSAEALAKLSNSRFLQKAINTRAKREVGFAANPFLDGEEKLVPGEDSEDEDLAPEERKKRREEKERKRKLEAQGFTLVTMDDVTGGNKRRGRDTYGTVVEGITEEEMAKLVEKQKMKQQLKEAADDEGPGYTTNKEKRNQIK
mmetsp:Transcript_31445/g.41644  ORF Transcript_31445/g.41644 Transcript_31445/m.41644 type:complete len:211 (+) Transcript_31445:134-766(+)